MTLEAIYNPHAIATRLNNEEVIYRAVNENRIYEALEYGATDIFSAGEHDTADEDAAQAIYDSIFANGLRAYEQDELLYDFGLDALFGKYDDTEASVVYITGNYIFVFASDCQRKDDRD